MAIIAKLNYLRIAPRKVRMVADLVRRKSVGEAQNILNFTVKNAAEPLQKLLKSAIASARHNFHLDETNLYISKLTVDEGPKLKRWRPRARGTAYEIQKKTSHITLVLDEIEKKASEVEKIEEVEKSEKIEKEKKIEKPLSRSQSGEAKIKKPETEIAKPKTGKGVKRFFRRQVF